MFYENNCLKIFFKIFLVKKQSLDFFKYTNLLPILKNSLVSKLFEFHS
jgi:hypothetical protein